MASFNSWPVISMPATPAPKTIEASFESVVGVSTNPFSGQQQVYDWGANWMELKISMPPMEGVINGPAWVNFLISCNGMSAVFQIANTTWIGLIPASANVNGYWRLKTNSAQWSINDGVIYGMVFEIREAI